MNGLMLHCGGQARTREEVFKVPLPQATESYCVLSHESFITRIEKQLGVEGITIRNQHFALAKEGQRLFGLMELGFAAHGLSDDHVSVLGFRNSYDKTIKTGLCVGARVLVCDNLSFHGDHLTFLRKHTPNLLRDLSWVLSETIGKIPEYAQAQSLCFHRYKCLPLTSPEVHDLVIRLYDEGALNVTHIPEVLKEWRSPRHPEFQETYSGWRLFNAVTETIKGDLWALPNRTRALHKLLDDATSGIAESDLELGSSIEVPVQAPEAAQ